MLDKERRALIRQRREPRASCVREMAATQTGRSVKRRKKGGDVAGVAAAYQISHGRLAVPLRGGLELTSALPPALAVEADEFGGRAHAGRSATAAEPGVCVPVEPGGAVGGGGVPIGVRNGRGERTSLSRSLSFAAILRVLSSIASLSLRAIFSSTGAGVGEGEGELAPMSTSSFCPSCGLESGIFAR